MDEHQALIPNGRQHIAVPASETLVDYFTYNRASIIELQLVIQAVQMLSENGGLVAELANAFEPGICDQRAWREPERFMFCLFESSQSTINRLTVLANRSDNPDIFQQFVHALNGLTTYAHNDSLFRYLLPGNFVTEATLTRDLHPSLLNSRFSIFFSDTFKPKRHLVWAYIDRQRFDNWDLLISGYSQLLGLAEIDQNQLTTFNSSPSELFRSALDKLRSRTVEQVLRAILHPNQPAHGCQLLRLGHLIAFSLGHPSLDSNPEPAGCFGILREAVTSLMRPWDDAKPLVRVSKQFVLRLLGSLIVIDEYPNGQPSVNFARLICAFQRVNGVAVDLAEQGVFVAPYCADQVVRTRLFGSGSRPLETFIAKQLSHPSVNAVVIFVGPQFASRLSPSYAAGAAATMESELVRACLFHGRQVLLVSDDGVLPKCPDGLVSDNELLSQFVLPLSREEDEVVWRNFLVYLANLPRPAQEIQLMQQVVRMNRPDVPALEICGQL